MWFGPPRCFTTASSCPWIGHPVSGLLYATIRPFETRSRYGSGALHLNLATHSNSPARSTKSTWSLSLPLLVNIGFQVLFHSPPGVLFTFPSFSSSGYLDVSVHRVPSVTLCIHVTVTALNDRRVSPFRYPWINACLQLPMAFRSLPRLSSALGTKASTLRSY